MKAPLLALVVLAAGCSEVALSALTVPPPGKTAQLGPDGDAFKLTLSRGTAFAFECTARGDGYNGPCRDANVTSTDEGVASVYASYLDTLGSAWENGRAAGRARAAFVVVGLAAGEAQVEILTSDGHVDLSIEIVP